ncbi:MAG: hypothetical protein XXXJIFNMEKO3_01302 [Candidatus Erwinia impunctatus]
MNITPFHASAPLTDLVFGDTVFFPPLFKAVLLGFFFWLLLHTLSRNPLYSGEFWHPTLLDLSLFVLCVSTALWLLTHW